MSNIFGRVSVPATTVDGVAIPSFEAPMIAVYAVSHIEGSDWEEKILSPMIILARAQGASAEAEAISEATAEVNSILSKIDNPILEMLLEAPIDAEINSLLTSVFTVVLAAVQPKA